MAKEQFKDHLRSAGKQGGVHVAYIAKSFVHGFVHPPKAFFRRDLEDEVIERDLDSDAEGLFGREYDPLDERDIEDLFVRDLEAEELFGREY